MLQAKPINRSVVTDVLQADLFRILEQSGESFEVMVFKAAMASEGAETDASEFVGTLEAQETKLTYQSPITCKAIELPNNMQGEFITASGGFGDGELQEATTMVFSDPEIPEQSLILMNEQVGESIVSSMFYVLDVLPIGKHGAAGKKHLLIPFRGDVMILLDANDDDIPQVHEFGDLSGLLAQ